MSDPQWAIYGLGRAGGAIARACVARDLPLVAVGVRAEDSKGRDFKGAPVHVGLQDFLQALPADTTVLLAVRDDAIEPTAKSCAAIETSQSLRFCHLSGALGFEPLHALIDQSRPCGVFHLLQSFPETGGDARIPGSYVGVVGAEPLASDLRGLANQLECTPFTLNDNQRSAYHAAAVLASNALVTLLGTGRDILIQSGMDEELASRMLLPLVEGTLRNLSDSSPEDALTGPVARGDVGTIKKHLKALEGEARATYIAMMRATVGMAQRVGKVPPQRLQDILEFLGEEI